MDALEKIHPDVAPTPDPAPCAAPLGMRHDLRKLRTEFGYIDLNMLLAHGWTEADILAHGPEAATQLGREDYASGRFAVPVFGFDATRLGAERGLGGTGAGEPKDARG